MLRKSVPQAVFNGATMDLTFEFDEERTLGAIVYLAAKKVAELTKWKICELLYLADRIHLTRFGRLITGDVYYALPWGPVPSYTLDALDDESPLAMLLVEVLEKDTSRKYPTYTAAPGSEAVSKDNLSDTDRWALDQAAEQYGCLSFKELGTVVHNTAAYRKAWAKRTGDRVLIRFEDFFEDAPDAHPELLEELLDNLQADHLNQ